MTHAEPVLAARAAVGESPRWDQRDSVLWWVDMMAGELHRFDPATGVDEVTWRGSVSAVALRARGGVVLVVRDAVIAADGGGRRLTSFDLEEGTRMNDAAVDPAGRLWAGSMVVEGPPGRAGLFRWISGQHATLVVDGLSISNGIDWSPDGRTMYHVDTPTRTVHAYDMDPSTGDLRGRRPFIELEHGAGVPDGITVDAEGSVWVALWGGAAVHRFRPDGSLDRVVELPVTLVTSCTFGGRDGTDLFITTARATLDGGELQRQPHAGDLFVARTDVPGRLPACIDA